MQLVNDASLVLARFHVWLLNDTSIEMLFVEMHSIGYDWVENEKQRVEIVCGIVPDVTVSNKIGLYTYNPMKT